MKVWITKYALTSGIFDVEAIEFIEGETMVSYRRHEGRYTEYANGNDWHKNEADAIKRAEEMRLKKIASMLKHLDKLQAMEFKAAEVPA